MGGIGKAIGGAIKGIVGGGGVQKGGASGGGPGKGAMELVAKLAEALVGGGR